MRSLATSLTALLLVGTSAHGAPLSARQQRQLSRARRQLHRHDYRSVLRLAPRGVLELADGVHHVDGARIERRGNFTVVERGATTLQLVRRSRDRLLVQRIVARGRAHEHTDWHFEAGTLVKLQRALKVGQRRFRRVIRRLDDGEIKVERHISREPRNGRWAEHSRELGGRGETRTLWLKQGRKSYKRTILPNGRARGTHQPELRGVVDWWRARDIVKLAKQIMTDGQAREPQRR